MGFAGSSESPCAMPSSANISGMASARPLVQTSSNQRRISALFSSDIFLILLYENLLKRLKKTCLNAKDAEAFARVHKGDLPLRSFAKYSAPSALKWSLTRASLVLTQTLNAWARQKTELPSLVSQCQIHQHGTYARCDERPAPEQSPLSR